MKRCVAYLGAEETTGGGLLGGHRGSGLDGGLSHGLGGGLGSGGLGSLRQHRQEEGRCEVGFIFNLSSVEMNASARALHACSCGLSTTLLCNVPASWPFRRVRLRGRRPRAHRR